MSIRRMPLGGAVALAWASMAACAGGGGTQTDPLPGEQAIGLARGETLPSFTPAETAKLNWSRAEEAFEEENYILAQRYYGHIRRKFPYSKYAVLSDLRFADCNFERERHLEAIDGYRNFVRLHPTHPKVAYAMFRTGRAYEAQIPNNWFFLPPAHEKDQSAVRDTAKALSRFLERFPDAENAEEARAMLADVRGRLMAHERYVADFYKREGKLRGYVGRLEHIREAFADVGLDADLLVEIVDAYVALGDPEGARDALAELEEKFPEDPRVAAAERSVAKLTEVAQAEAAVSQAP
jgi:outer membrane protein assembly factor BamD